MRKIKTVSSNDCINLACENCKHENVSAIDEPCKGCKMTISKWEEKK